MRSRTVLLPALFALCGGCRAPAVDPRPDEAEARRLIEAATGRREVFDPATAGLASAEVDALLADGLTLDESLRLALLENRALQSAFLGLGVARADYVQAGLLRNPRLSASFLFPSATSAPKLGAELALSLSDVWELPRRQALAEQEAQRRICEVSLAAGELVARAKSAYYECVAARELAAAGREGLELARRTQAAVEERAAAGVAGRPEIDLARSEALQAELALQSAEQRALRTARDLAALLSLEQDLAPIELTDALPQPGAPAADLEAILATSRAQRLDLRAAHAALAAAEADVRLARRRQRPELEVGAGFERPEGGSDGASLAGPTAAVELPLFDSRATALRRAELRRDQVRRECEALQAALVQDVRAAVDRADSAARTARFVADELVPQARAGLALAREALALGDTLVVNVLESQRHELGARTSAIEAGLALAQAQADLERAAGAPLATLAEAARR